MERSLSKLDEKKIQSWRIRTILYSIIASGLVASFIGNAFETAVYNRNVVDQIIACNNVYRDREFLMQISSEVARAADRSDTRNRWRGYQREFESRLPPNAPRCDRIYTKRSFLPFIE